MAFRDPSERAQFNWASLDHDARFRAVQWSAAYLRNRPELRKHLGAGVLRVGAGLRHRRSAGKRSGDYVDEPALVVTVVRKLSQAAKARSRRSLLVPPTIELRVSIDARRILLAIPTDVQARPKIPRAQAQTQGIRARPQSAGKRVDGTACALVQNKDGTGPFYLLGCHHVLLRSLVMPDVSPDPTAQLFTIPGGEAETLIGVPTRPAVFGPDEIGSLDAALVRLNQAGETLASDPSYWNAFPIGWARDLDEVRLLAQSGLFLYARGGKVVDLKLVEHTFDQIVGYPNGDVVIAEILRCVSQNPAQPAPVGGDSGSPVLDSTGVFIGMHIAGIPSDRESYVIPSYLLIEGPAFHRKITLAVWS